MNCMWGTIESRWYLFLGWIFENLRRYGKTSPFIAVLATWYPRSLMAHCRLAWAYQLHERYADAIPEYERALQIKPDYAFAHAGLGWSFLHLGRFQEAVDSLHRASRIRPEYEDDCDHVTAIASAYQRLGQIDLAIRDCERARSLDPSDAETAY